LDFEVIKNDIRRYLGTSTVLDELTEKKIDIILDEMIRDYTPRHIHGVYDIFIEDHKVLFSGTSLVIESKDLSSLLEKADKCIVIATTLGIEIERKLKYYSVNELELGILYDAIAAAYIEGYLDSVNREFIQKYNEEGYYLTMRYSPGYGDVDLIHQKDIIDILHANKRIGLTTNDSHLMIPRKSITAIIGLQTTPTKEVRSKCGMCSLKKECELRKGGNPCGIAK